MMPWSDEMFEKRRQREEREESRGVGCREKRQNLGKKEEEEGDVGRSLVLWYHKEGKKKLVLNCLSFPFV
jgi:hypothetical protein